MWRRLRGFARSSRLTTNGVAALAVAGVVVVGLTVDDAVVTRVESESSDLWLPVENVGRLVQIDSARGIATTRVDLTDPGVQVEVIDGPGLLGVVEVESGDLITVDPALGIVQSRVSTGASDVVGSVVGDVGAWFVGRDTAVLVAPGAEEPTVIELPGRPSSVAAGGGGVAVVIDDRLHEIDAEGIEPVGEPSPGLAVVELDGGPVVVDPAQNVVSMSGEPMACLSESARSASRWGGSAHGDAVVAGVEPLGGVVHVADLRSARCRSYEIGSDTSTLGVPLVVDGVMYVVDESDGRVLIVDLEDASVESVAAFSAGERTELIYHDGEVIGHEPRTVRGAVFGPDGLRRFINKSAGSGLVTVVAADAAAVVVGAEGSAAIEGEAAGGGDLVADGPLLEEPIVLGAQEGSGQGDRSGEALVANFAFSTDRVTVGEPVVFIDESTGGPRTWTWDFGDGTNAVGERVEKIWDAPGTYQVTLTVDRFGESASLSAFIEVVATETLIPPVADFTFSDTTVAVGDTVEFVDVSTGEIDSRLWDFGNGATATGASESASWPSPGSYTVTLTVTNEAGSSSASAVIDVVEILVPPTAVIEADPVVVEVGEPVRFRSLSTGNISQLVWDFGDGITTSVTQPQHAYQSAGSYTVRLTATNGAGSSTDTVVITVQPSTLVPVARIGSVPPVIETGRPVTLSSLSINDPDTLSWEFGDGDTGSGEAVTHTWGTAGVYKVSLTATNEQGSDTTTVDVTVLAYVPPPTAGFVGPPAVRVGTAAVFEDRSTNAETIAWDFGDGTAASTTDAVHTYSQAGTFTVTQTVTNRNGTASTSANIVVLPALPQAGFTFSPVAPRAGQTVIFSNTSENAETYDWTFGDTTPGSTLTSPSHVYAASGTYTVALEARNASGEVSTSTASVVVDPPAPVLGAVAITPSPGVTLSPVSFSTSPGVGSGPITNYTFDFGDGTSASSVTGNVTHTYGTAGNYSVVVTATGAKATDTATVTVPLVVNDPPPPLVTITSVVPATPETGQTTQLMAAPSIGSGPITSWSWTFGDGTPPSNLQNPTHAWITPGTYTVTVTATGPTGATGGDQKLVTVVLPPVPVIGSATATPNSVFTGDPVSFTATVGGTSGPITSWFWNFGDGVGTSTLQNPGYTYTSAGTYTATVTAAGPGGTSAPVTVLVQVSDPPPVITVPSASPSGPAIGQAVAFSVGPALGSGPITSWSWTFGDGIGTSTLQTPSYTYTSAGIYTATVTATGPGGIDTDTVVVQVGQPVLNAPTYLPVPAFTGEPVTFSVTAVGGASRPITSWSWTFGDGGTATVQNPSHTYAGAGSYTATVTATGPGGTSTPVSVLVVVGDPVTAGFTWSPLGGLAVQFTDTSTGAPPVTWAWTFGDGATSSAANPSHTYGSTGPFTVRLTVTDAFGHTDFTEQVVTPLP